MAFYDASSRYVIDRSNAYATRVPLKAGSYRLYTIKSGDTLENLALSIFGDTKRAWEIADINPQIKFPLDLRVGAGLRLPL